MASCLLHSFGSRSNLDIPFLETVAGIVQRPWEPVHRLPPETDGQPKRLNSVVEKYFRIYTDFQQSDRASPLPVADFS